jgi:predicted dienelactone hydrolase
MSERRMYTRSGKSHPRDPLRDSRRTRMPASGWRGGGRSPRLGRKAAIALASIFLAVLALTVVSASMFTLPAPTGPYLVSTASFTTSRTPYRDQRDAGTYGVQIWYPSQRAASRAAYEPSEMGLKGGLYDRLIHSHAGDAAPALTTLGSLPVLIYVASWGGRRNENTVLSEELASRGFVVAGLDDVVHDTPSLRALAGPLDLTSDEAYQRSLTLGAEKVAYEAQRASELLDRLLLPATLARYGLADRLDRRRIGILGYSFGGAVARFAAKRDPRFRSTANLDGWLFPVGSETRATAIPYLLVASKDPPPQWADLHSSDPVHRHSAMLDSADAEAQLREFAHEGYFVEIDGAEHMSFSDLPLYSLSMRFKARVDPVHLSRLVGTYVTAFFEATLNERRPPILDANETRDRSVTVRRWVHKSPTHSANESNR